MRKSTLVCESNGVSLRVIGEVEHEKDVNALGFLLGNKTTGPFKLEVEWIKVVRAGQ